MRMLNPHNGREKREFKEWNSQKAGKQKTTRTTEKNNRKNNNNVEKKVPKAN